MLICSKTIPNFVEASKAFKGCAWLAYKNYYLLLFKKNVPTPPFHPPQTLRLFESIYL